MAPSPSNGAPVVRGSPLEGSILLDPDNLVASEGRSARGGHNPTAPLVDTIGDGADTPYQPFNEHFSHHGGEGDTDTPHNGEDVLESCYSPLYGDPRGVGLVADICEPERKGKSGHFLVPRMGSTHMDPETIEYLRLKGVFNLPTSAVCQMLIRAYFHYVHHFFPVVDASSFLKVFENSPEKVSIHLLWSMFLAAANFADETTLKAANFSSRKEMNRSMYIRAKALYDAEYERRKTTLIQAVLLMGFWYSDTEDRTGPWHWNGIAISLCQRIGLYRQPDTSQSHIKAIPPSDRRIWRQIWWSCVYREAWFSAGMGRPMRINLADCSTPMPDANDSDELLSGIPEITRKKYLPEGTEELSKLWTGLLGLSVSLSNILSWQNQAERTRPSRAEIEQTDHNIRLHYCRNRVIAHRQCQIVSLHAYHIELYLESVILILYRPFLFEKTGSDSPSDSANEWRSTVERKTRDAATNTNRILGSMISDDLISNCQAIICIALVPTLQVHLIDSTSSKSLVQRMGCHNLELCMIVIEELRTIYFGAEILFRMFTKAQRQIRNQRLAPATTPGAASGMTTNAADDAYQENVEVFGAFPATWNPFASVSANGFFDNNELMNFESDFMLSQLMLPNSEPSGKAPDNGNLSTYI